MDPSDRLVYIPSRADYGLVKLMLPKVTERKKRAKYYDIPNIVVYASLIIILGNIPMHMTYKMHEVS